MRPFNDKCAFKIQAKELGPGTAHKPKSRAQILPNAGCLLNNTPNAFHSTTKVFCAIVGGDCGVVLFYLIKFVGLGLKKEPAHIRKDGPYKWEEGPH